MSQDFSRFEEPPRKQQPAAGGRSVRSIVIPLLVIGALLFVVVCCGGGIWIANFGMSLVSADIERQLRDHPQIRQHLGEIQSLDVNWAQSIAHDDDDTFVYDVVGSNNSGEITVESISNDDGGEDIVWAELRLSDGETIELSLE